MITDELLIIEALIESRDKELTIHQISKVIKKSYAFTNKYAHSLIKAKVIRKKEIGPSILCSLNFLCEMTIASLVYISMLKKTRYETNERQEDAIDKYSKIGVLAHYNEKIMLISDEKVKDTRLRVISRQEFLSDVKSYDLSKFIVLANHEQFWKMVAKVMP
jgi:hypothetical protein